MRLVLALLLLALLVAGGVWLWAGRVSHRPGSFAWRAVDRQVADRYPEVPLVTTDQLSARMSSSVASPLLLDARTPEEFAVSHLPGARRVDPDATVAELADSLAWLDRQRPLVVYCSVGVRSGAVARRLREAGFTEVANLRGSIFRWANEGRTLIHDGQLTTKVHPYDPVWGRLLDPAYRAE